MSSRKRPALVTTNFFQFSRWSSTRASNEVYLRTLISTSQSEVISYRSIQQPATDPCTLICFFFFIFFYFYFILFYFIVTIVIHLQYSYTVLTYNKTTKFTYVTALLLTCLLLTYIKIPKTSLQQTKGLLKTINK